MEVTGEFRQISVRWVWGAGFHECTHRNRAAPSKLDIKNISDTIYHHGVH